MAKESRIVSVAQLRQNPSGAMRRVRDSKRPLVVSRMGRATAVLLSVETYERGERERNILRELARGEREIAAGRGICLERVLADADKVLARTRK